jgi:hypothetical protein
MFDAGYYGVAQVNMHGKGQQGLGAGTDHWVMLCGMRRYVKDRSVCEEILVGDSALSYPTERWIPWREFLMGHGGFMAFFARPRVVQ